MHTIWAQPFLSRYFAPLPSCSAYFAIHEHDYIFRRDHASQNMHYIAIFASFCAVSPLAFVHASHFTHPQSFLPIHTHFPPYMHTLAKHDARGNFPGHRGRKHDVFAYFGLCLPCFAMRLCPCTPTHPCKPLRTHLHPHIPVLTLFVCVAHVNFNTKIVNLIITK